ncbi:hypothetical protein ACTXT7_000488 [Hymenolepis weldensis]
MASALKAPSKFSHISIPDSRTKPQTLSKRTSMQLTATKPEPFTRMTLRSAALKSKNGDDMNLSIQQNKKGKICIQKFISDYNSYAFVSSNTCLKFIAPATRSLQKPTVTRTRLTVADSAAVSESQTQKSPTANSTAKTYGIGTSTATKAKNIPSSSNIQPQKSLKDKVDLDTPAASFNLGSLDVNFIVVRPEGICFASGVAADVFVCEVKGYGFDARWHTQKGEWPVALVDIKIMIKLITVCACYLVISGLAYDQREQFKEAEAFNHLAEIRANATPRRASEVASPVATRLRKNSKPTITTSVTSATVSLRRTNSLIPKTSGRPTSSAFTSTNSVASKALLAEKEAELIALKQCYKANATQWNKAFDAFCIFSQWSINKRDEHIEWASKRQKELEENVKALSEECTQIKADMEQLIQQQTKSQAEQFEAWEKERSFLCIEMERQRANFIIEKKKEIEKITYPPLQLQCEADILELQKAYDAQVSCALVHFTWLENAAFIAATLSEERKVWAARVAESHNKVLTQLDQQRIDYETQMAELKRQNAARVGELEGRLKSTESELLAKIERLQSECSELRKAAAENRERVPPEFQPVQFPSSTQPAMCDFSVRHFQLCHKQKSPMDSFNSALLRPKERVKNEVVAGGPCLRFIAGA